MRAIETARLIIRNFAVEDWPDLYEMVTQYRASEYAQYDHKWPRAPDEIKGVAEWFARRDDYLAVFRKRRDEKEGQVHGLGYVFHPDYHGQGVRHRGLSGSDGPPVSPAGGRPGGHRHRCGQRALLSPAQEAGDAGGKPAHSVL